MAELRARGVRFYMLCGRPEKEVLFADEGFAAEVKSGYAYDGWPVPVYHCRASESQVEIVLTVPTTASGRVRVYIIDPDHFQGGRSQDVTVDGKSSSPITEFADGRWLEWSVGPDETADGRIVIKARNAKANANAVVSIVEWIEGP